MNAPPIGLGTWQLRGRTCRRAVSTALELGYGHIDTAEGYENESDIGAALRGVSRDSLFLVSKVWRDHLRSDDVERACEGSLGRLRTEYLDVLLIHWPNREVPLAETVEGFRRLLEDGRIRAWGVSNFTAARLAQAVEVGTRSGAGPPATNQVELHPFFNQTRLLEAARRLGVALTAYSPLGRGAVLDVPAIGRIAERSGGTPAQVALAWVLSKGCVTIPKATSRAHLAENLKATELRLTAEEIQELNELPQQPRLFEFPWSEFDD